MTVGCDTGFFIELLLGNPVAASFWEAIGDGHDDAVVSILSLFELRVLGETKEVDAQSVQIVLAAIQSLCTVVKPEMTQGWDQAIEWVNTHGFSVQQALIAEAFISKKVDKILTSDQIFQCLQNDHLTVTII